MESKQMEKKIINMILALLGVCGMSLCGMFSRMWVMGAQV